MAKEANKSTVIVLLVIAGVLLFLVGSFTGNASNWFTKYKTTQTTTGLTNTQIKQVLTTIRDCHTVNFPQGNTPVKDITNCETVCSSSGSCILALATEPFRDREYIINCYDTPYEAKFVSCLCCNI